MMVPEETEHCLKHVHFSKNVETLNEIHRCGMFQLLKLWIQE